MPARKATGEAFQANLYVVSRFLDRLSEPRKWTRGGLQAACGVNYDIFRRYLAVLETKGFVTSEKDGRVRITPEGVAWRQQLQGVLADFLQQPPGSRTTPSKVRPRTAGADVGAGVA